MKRDTLSKLENFIRKRLPIKLRNDLKRMRITKEAEVECCIYHHLRNVLPADGAWTILARKFSRRTGHYIDLIVLRKECPRLAIEIKWNQKRMSKKDRHSLNAALIEMRVNKAYFVSVGPDITKKSYKKKRKRPHELHRLHEIPIGLGFKASTAKSKTKLWKEQRHLLGRNMRLGKARVKKL